jgi:hypothetical protein
MDTWPISVPFLESSCHLYSVVYQIPYAKILSPCVEDVFVILEIFFLIASFNGEVGKELKG